MNIRAIVCLLAFLAPLSAHAQGDVSLWLTNPDRSALFQLQTPPISFTHTPPANQVIDVDATKTYQTIDGFGFALTGGSAQLIQHMEPEKRAALLHELFATDGTSIGVSYLRLTIGASDMNEHVFSYDDLPEGQTDPTLAKFSLGPDRDDVVPVMKQILAINPHIKILASPWSAPLWMKTSGAAKGGVLKPEFFPAYAVYFVKYIQAMKSEGIPIDAVTIQNEPLNEKNTPSMLMLESEQADFIENNLGPAFKRAEIKTKIVLYDHNLDHPLYPLSIMRDPKASKYIDGTGFHLYGGTVEAMTQVHDAFPRKNLYFTEQMVVSGRRSNGGMDLSKPVARIIIGTTRNWSKNVLLWNLAADPSFGPHTNDGGCSGCQGAITIDGNDFTRNLAFYTLAHASKFVRPGSVRIASNTFDSLPNVAFKTTDGKKVLIVANTSTTAQKFDVRSRTNLFTASLDAGAVGTYIW
jgi:glucosylceramidase